MNYYGQRRGYGQRRSYGNRGYRTRGFTSGGRANYGGRNRPPQRRAWMPLWQYRQMKASQRRRAGYGQRRYTNYRSGRRY